MSSELADHLLQPRAGRTGRSYDAMDAALYNYVETIANRRRKQNDEIVECLRSASDWADWLKKRYQGMTLAGNLKEKSFQNNFATKGKRNCFSAFDRDEGVGCQGANEKENAGQTQPRASAQPAGKVTSIAFRLIAIRCCERGALGMSTPSIAQCI